MARMLPLKDDPRTTRETVGYLLRAVGMVFRASRPLTLALAALTLVSAALPVAVAWVGKALVDAVVAGQREQALRWVAVELALAAALATAGRGLVLVRQVLGSRLGIDINVSLLEKARRLTLRHFEDSATYDRLTRARREASSRPVSLVTDGFSLVQGLLTLGGYAALLSQLGGWVVLLLLGSAVPATLAELRYSKQGFRLRNWRSPEARRLMYLEHVLANDEHVKEIKLFDLGPLFLGRYRELAERFHGEDSRLAVKRAAVTHALSLLASGAFYGAYASMAVAAATRAISLGEMTLYVLAFRQGQQAFQGILQGIASIYEHGLYMSNLFAFLELDASAGEGEGEAREAIAAPVSEGIVFSGVGFRYPGADGWVLRGLDLTVRPGESIALVGTNGAGKTTLIKLLTRLYEPSEGRIFLDGRDLRDWDERELHQRFGVVFQDFNQYQLTLRENVGVGSVEHLDDAPRIERAVERGGARGVVDGAKGGLDAQLGRWFERGAELSGGQWQKLALARAFMREQADILVLDEPTAALDAEAEHAVFERFKQLAEGRTTFVISHRFPTVRMADRILVLDRGVIAESGTHEQLLAREGLYARLYRMQAEGYS